MMQDEDVITIVYNCFNNILFPREKHDSVNNGYLQDKFPLPPGKRGTVKKTTTHTTTGCSQTGTPLSTKSGLTLIEETIVWDSCLRRYALTKYIQIQTIHGGKNHGTKGHF